MNPESAEDVFWQQVHEEIMSRAGALSKNSSADRAFQAQMENRFKVMQKMPKGLSYQCCLPFILSSVEKESNK